MRFFFFYFLVTVTLLFRFENLSADTGKDTLFDYLEGNIASIDDSTFFNLIYQIQNKNENIDSLTLARIFYLKGKHTLIRTIEYPTAYNYISRALLIFNKLNRVTEEGKCELQLGLIFYIQRNFDEAANHFESSLIKMLATSDSARIGRLAYLLGITYIEKKELSKSHFYLKSSGLYSLKSSSAASKTEYSRGMGLYHLAKRNADSALYYFQPLYKASIIQEDTLSIQRHSAEIAKAWEIKGNIDSTEYYANKIILSGRNSHTEFVFIDIYHILYEIALKKHDYKKAVDYLNKYVLLKDSVINEKNLFEIASIKTNFALENERQESKIREAQQEAVIQRQNIMKYVSILFVVFLLSIVLLLRNRHKALAVSYEKLKSTQEQLINQEKLASMGKLSAGMAHEMLNPLNFVIGFSKSARDLVDEYSKASTQEEQSSIIAYTKKAISKISEHADRMALSVNQVINHVRLTSGKRELTDIHQLCNTYLSMAMNSMKMQNSDINCLVTNDYSANIPLVSINPQEFGRILINILNNSFLALEEKLLTEKFQPEINIKTTRENNSILISITDNGIGIKKEIINKIFDHFYTTRLPGKGVGLGLSVANDIVKSYGGKISAQSDPGVFTTITFSIPV